MNGRSGLTTFFLFLFMIAVIFLQYLQMVQSDRLYERVNTLSRALESRPVRTSADGGEVDDGQFYPGEEGDWLIIGLSAEPATLNPITSRDVYESYVSGSRYQNIFESLMQYDPERVELVPFLAESYELAQDGLSAGFVIRSEAQFSDGVAVTAEDVVFSYNTINDPYVDAAHLASYFRPIESVEKLGERQVRFTFREPYFKAFEMVGLMPIFPEHVYGYEDAQEFNSMREPFGSGPYVLDRWDTGSRIVLRRNENYWGTKPNIRRLVFRIFTNEFASLQSLRSGNIDMMMPTSEQFVEFRDDERFGQEFEAIEYWSPLSGYSYIGWNANTEFFSDRRVRQAMTMLVDRQAVIDSILQGLGAIVTGPFYIHGPQYDSSLEPWPYDPARAGQLLDEAGWKVIDGIRQKDGVKFSFDFMVVSGSPVMERLVRVLRDYFAQASIEMTAQPYEWSVFQQRLHGRNFEATTLGWGGVVLNDPFQIWHSSQSQDRGSNYVSFNNAEADELIEQARRTLDDDERNALYHRLHRILHAEQPYTFFRTSPALLFLHNRFENVRVHTLGINIHEWYVPAERQRHN